MVRLDFFFSFCFAVVLVRDGFSLRPWCKSVVGSPRRLIMVEILFCFWGFCELQVLLDMLSPSFCLLFFVLDCTRVEL